MDQIIEKAVERVILDMRRNLGEPITIDDMARTAMFSKFHFSRIFQRVTGVSPGRFLSALRIQEAKRLLRTTAMTVADISHLVGYNSIGTFSSRFRASVGLSPTEYRQQSDAESSVPPVPPVSSIPEQRDNRRDSASISGHVWCPRGLYPDRIAQGEPVRSVARVGRGQFVMEDVPAGHWHVLARSAGVADEAVPDPDADTDPRPYECNLGPVEVNPGQSVCSLDLWMHTRSVFDPPVLLADLDQPADAWAPDRMAQMGQLAQSSA
jgi:AraC family transcriptional regulator